MLLGVRAVIAESFERIHRSNLIGMGVAPLQFRPGQNVASLGLTGRERFDITGLSRGDAGEVTRHRDARRRQAAAVQRARAHRHAEGARVLPARRHPAVRAAAARRGGRRRLTAPVPAQSPAARAAARTDAGGVRSRRHAHAPRHLVALPRRVPHAPSGTTACSCCGCCRRWRTSLRGVPTAAPSKPLDRAQSSAAAAAPSWRRGRREFVPHLMLRACGRCARCAGGPPPRRGLAGAADRQPRPVRSGHRSRTRFRRDGVQPASNGTGTASPAASPRPTAAAQRRRAASKRCAAHPHLPVIAYANAASDLEHLRLADRAVPGEWRDGARGGRPRGVTIARVRWR